MAHSLQNTQSAKNDHHPGGSLNLSPSKAQWQKIGNIAVLGAMAFLILWSWNAGSLFLNELLVVGGILGMISLVRLIGSPSETQ